MLTKIVSRNDFQESLQKLSLSSNGSMKNTKVTTNQSETISSVEEVKRYDWPMLVNFKVDEKFKKNTENVLNIIKTQNDQRNEVYPLATVEMRTWLETLKTNPKLAKQTFSFLLAQPEIKSMEFLNAELIKISKFINFDKRKVLEISEEAIEENLSDETNLEKLSLEDYGHFLKVKEAAIFILDENKLSKSEMELAAKAILLKNNHPLIEREVMNYVKHSFPNSEPFIKR